MYVLAKLLYFILPPCGKNIKKKAFFTFYFTILVCYLFFSLKFQFCVYIAIFVYFHRALFCFASLVILFVLCRSLSFFVYYSKLIALFPLLNMYFVLTLLLKLQYAFFFCLVLINAFMRTWLILCSATTFHYSYFYLSFQMAVAILVCFHDSKFDFIFFSYVL